MKIKKLRSGPQELQLTCEDWRPEYAEHFSAGGCDGLFVGCPRPDAAIDLSFVRTLPGLRSVRLGLGVRDPSPLSDCAGLTDLRIGLGQRGRVDFSGLTGLRRLEAPAGVGLETVAALTALESVTAPGWRRGSLASVLGPKPRLTQLRIECPRTGEVSMSGAEDLPALRELRVYDGRLLDADALTAVPGLGSVELYGAKPAGVEFVSGLLRLERLVLENCGPIPSLAPLADHPALREVVLAGRTVVEDGDLSPLVHHPGLRYVALERGAEHYSHRPAEVRRG